jgi:hypothetical protein
MTALAVGDLLPSLASLTKSWSMLSHFKCAELPYTLFERSRLVLCKENSCLTLLFQHERPCIRLKRLSRSPCFLRLILIKPMTKLIGPLSQISSSTLVLVQNVLVRFRLSSPMHWVFVYVSSALTYHIPLHRSIRQGCPLATLCCWLFQDYLQATRGSCLL